MDIIQANLIENMVDENIGKHYKIIGLEKTCDSIKQTLHNGEKRMDNMEADIKDIKDSQVIMGNGIVAIKQSVNGNGVKGLAQLVDENAKMISQMAKGCLSHKNIINRIDNSNSWMYKSIGLLLASSFIGLMFYIVKNHIGG